MKRDKDREDREERGDILLGAVIVGLCGAASMFLLLRLVAWIVG